jgi:ubiquinone/menaquinone biosynthesis C-methylase UbiE
MAGDKRAARERFDRWAGRYERDRRSRFNGAPQRRALEALALGPGDRFLDVGCGTGAAVRAAAPLVERANGVDLSPEMIERARVLAGDVVGASLVVGDSESLPFPAGAFSAVLCSSSFHHYPVPERALAEMARVLRPGGRVAIADGSADLWAARVADRLLRTCSSLPGGRSRTPRCQKRAQARTRRPFPAESTTGRCRARPGYGRAVASSGAVSSSSRKLVPGTGL